MSAATRKNTSRRPAPHTRTASRSSRKKNLYRKSRYYQKQRKKIMAAGGIVFIFLLILLIFGLRACIVSRLQTSKDTSVSAAPAENSAVSAETGEDTASLPEKPVTITVSVVGDCTLGTDEAFDYDSSLNAYYYSYGKEYFFSNVKSIFENDDLTIANMEGALTDYDEREDKQFAFKAPAEFAGILSSGSVEAVNTANNHSHDYGEQGFSDTMEALDHEGIVHFGYDETAVMDVKGVKVGLVGIYELADHLNRTEQLKKNIAKVKEDGANLIIVIFHWGNEKEDVPDSNQTALGRLAIDEGADLVCGHHPHVLQGMETYKGKNILYSLGNFCFGGNSAPSDTDTIIYQQTFTVGPEGVQKNNVTNIIPCSISSEYGYNDYCPTPADGDEADRIMNKFQERSAWIDTTEAQE